jgi:hypothetical protein
MIYFQNLGLLLLALVLLPNHGTALQRQPKTLLQIIPPPLLYLVGSSEALIALAERWEVPERIDLPFDCSDENDETCESDDEADISSSKTITVELPVKLPSTAAIAVLNLVIFALWHCLPSVGFMARHFICSGTERVRQQLPHTYLTAGFSHFDVQHVLGNMCVSSSLVTLSKRI